MNKKSLGILAISVLSLGGTGIWGYQHFLNREVSPKELHVNDDFFDFSGLAVPLNPNTTGQDHTGASTGAVVKKDAAGKVFTQSQSSANTWQNEPDSSQQDTAADTPAISVQQIEAKYSPAFVRLRNEAFSRLDQLVLNAKMEYRNSRKSGAPSTSELISKYSSSARKLQNAVDSTFYQLLGQMKNDLNQANLPIDLVSQAENEYKTDIQNKRSELFAKVKLK